MPASYARVAYRRKGVTLVELVVVLALVGMVVAGVTQFLIYAMANWTRNDTQNRLYLDTNLDAVTGAELGDFTERPADLLQRLGDRHLGRQSVGPHLHAHPRVRRRHPRRHHCPE